MKRSRENNRRLRLKLLAAEWLISLAATTRRQLQPGWRGQRVGQLDRFVESCQHETVDRPPPNGTVGGSNSARAVTAASMSIEAAEPIKALNIS